MMISITRFDSVVPTAGAKLEAALSHPCENRDRKHQKRLRGRSRSTLAFHMTASRLPTHPVHPPPLRRRFCRNTAYKMLSSLVIVANVVTLCVPHDGMSASLEASLESVNVAFGAFFIAEMIVQMVRRVARGGAIVRLFDSGVVCVRSLAPPRGAVCLLRLPHLRRWSLPAAPQPGCTRNPPRFLESTTESNTLALYPAPPADRQGLLGLPLEADAPAGRPHQRALPHRHPLPHPQRREQAARGTRTIPRF